MQTSLIETTSFALRVGEYLLTALSKFWQVDYTFSKINQIVLPEFGSEGMPMSQSAYRFDMIIS